MVSSGSMSGFVPTPWRSYKEFLGEILPKSPVVRKASLNGGFTCPNLDGTVATGGCIYCDNRSFALSAPKRGHQIVEQLDQAREKIHYRWPEARLLAYFQPFTNTHAPVKQLRELYEAALQVEDVCALAIGTRPDCVNEEVAGLLIELIESHGKPILLELGLQTSSDRTQELINRAHRTEEWSKAWELLSHKAGIDWSDARASRECSPKRRLPLYLAAHVILGLPEESTEDWMATADYLAKHPVDSVKIHPMHVVRNTTLAEWFERGDYVPPELDLYAEGAARFIQKMPRHMAIERISGETQPGYTLAPDWSGNRPLILERIRAAMV
jgi:radical SAM protein (TIGR01212 family)